MQNYRNNLSERLLTFASDVIKFTEKINIHYFTIRGDYLNNNGILCLKKRTWF